MIEAAVLMVVLIGKIARLYLELIQVQMLNLALSGGVSAIGDCFVKVKEASALDE